MKGQDPESNEARAHMKLVTTVEHLDYDYAEPELSEEEKIRWIPVGLIQSLVEKNYRIYI